jgi:hypothetical protein
MVRNTILVLLLLLSTASCGSNLTGPSSVQVAGAWTGTQTLIKLSGGECVGDGGDGVVGSVSSFAMTITQSGSNLNAISGGCSYSGNAGSTAFTLDWIAGSCQAGERNLVCANGAIRDTNLRAFALSGVVTGNTASGTATYTVDVFNSGTATTVGVLVEDVAFTIKR